MTNEEKEVRNLLYLYYNHDLSKVNAWFEKNNKHLNEYYTARQLIDSGEGATVLRFALICLTDLPYE